MSHQPENISAGTQVVTLIEARGPNGSLVHPRGAVGIVTRTPAVPGENFLVRFPDGFEKSLDRSQIEVLKHFKDRLGQPNAFQSSVRRNDSPSPAGAGEGWGEGARASRTLPDESLNSSFELEPHIIYRCVIGSRGYGLDTDESDTDRRGIYLAPAELQSSLFGAPEQFEDSVLESCYC